MPQTNRFSRYVQMPEYKAATIDELAAVPKAMVERDAAAIMSTSNIGTGYDVESVDNPLVSQEINNLNTQIDGLVENISTHGMSMSDVAQVKALKKQRDALYDKHTGLIGKAQANKQQLMSDLGILEEQFKKGTISADKYNYMKNYMRQGYRGVEHGYNPYSVNKDANVDDKALKYGQQASQNKDMYTTRPKGMDEKALGMSGFSGYEYSNVRYLDAGKLKTQIKNNLLNDEDVMNDYRQRVETGMMTQAQFESYIDAKAESTANALAFAEKNTHYNLSRNPNDTSNTYTNPDDLLTDPTTNMPVYIAGAPDNIEYKGASLENVVRGNDVKNHVNSGGVAVFHTFGSLNKTNTAKTLSPNQKAMAMTIIRDNPNEFKDVNLDELNLDIYSEDNVKLLKRVNTIYRDSKPTGIYGKFSNNYYIDNGEKGISILPKGDIKNDLLGRLGAGSGVKPYVMNGDGTFTMLKEDEISSMVSEAQKDGKFIFAGKYGEQLPMFSNDKKLIPELTGGIRFKVGDKIYVVPDRENVLNRPDSKARISQTKLRYSKEPTYVNLSDIPNPKDYFKEGADYVNIGGKAVAVINHYKEGLLALTPNGQGGFAWRRLDELEKNIGHPLEIKQK